MPKGTQIRHHPEFRNIDEIVWEALNQYGRTIHEIRDEDKAYVSDNPEHDDVVNSPIWHTKSEVDRYVERTLGVRLSDYGPKTRNNALYNEIVKSIGRLRRSGVLIDWQKVEKNYGAGVWRLDKTKFERFVRQTTKNQITGGDFYCSGMYHWIHVRQKQQAFREELLGEYQMCVLCGFRLADYLIGAHIVPYNIMRVKEPANSMNPVNGLLLCRLCDTAFEKGTIMVGTDYYIDVSDDLTSRDENMINAWLEHIPKKLDIEKNAKYPPDQRFLEWKTDLLRHP